MESIAFEIHDVLETLLLASAYNSEYISRVYEPFSGSSSCSGSTPLDSKSVQSFKHYEKPMMDFVPAEGIANSVRHPGGLRRCLRKLNRSLDALRECQYSLVEKDESCDIDHDTRNELSPCTSPEAEERQRQSFLKTLRQDLVQIITNLTPSMYANTGKLEDINELFLSACEKAFLSLMISNDDPALQMSQDTSQFWPLECGLLFPSELEDLLSHVSTMLSTSTLCVRESALMGKYLAAINFNLLALSQEDDKHDLSGHLMDDMQENEVTRCQSMLASPSSVFNLLQHLLPPALNSLQVQWQPSIALTQENSFERNVHHDNAETRTQLRILCIHLLQRMSGSARQNLSSGSQEQGTQDQFCQGQGWWIWLENEMMETKQSHIANSPAPTKQSSITYQGEVGNSGRSGGHTHELVLLFISEVIEYAFDVLDMAMGFFKWGYKEGVERNERPPDALCQDEQWEIAKIDASRQINLAIDALQIKMDLGFEASQNQTIVNTAASLWTSFSCFVMMLETDVSTWEEFRRDMIKSLLKLACMAIDVSSPSSSVSVNNSSISLSATEDVNLSVGEDKLNALVVTFLLAIENPDLLVSENKLVETIVRLASKNPALKHLGQAAVMSIIAMPSRNSTEDTVSIMEFARGLAKGLLDFYDPQDPWDILFERTMLKKFNQAALLGKS